ncbi:hypothetical protein PI124_g8945 [Phytophthora idaei]|nr:hypothetical protein PI124_g8945 [Phytophthora idaei]
MILELFIPFTVAAGAGVDEQNPGGKAIFGGDRSDVVCKLCLGDIGLRLI